jgi:hypothetical protein
MPTKRIDRRDKALFGAMLNSLAQRRHVRLHPINTNVVATSTAPQLSQERAATSDAQHERAAASSESPLHASFESPHAQAPIFVGVHPHRPSAYTTVGVHVNDPSSTCHEGSSSIPLVLPPATVSNHTLPPVPNILLPPSAISSNAIPPARQLLPPPVARGSYAAQSVGNWLSPFGAHLPNCSLLQMHSNVLRLARNRSVNTHTTHPTTNNF